MSDEQNAPAPLTVEAALVELRGMFPDRFIRVHESRSAVYDERDNETRLENPVAFVTMLGDGSPGSFNAPTLTEVMQQVRQWKENQQ